VVGDIGSDVAAAQAAGALGVLVPTEQTRPAEIAAAPIVLPDLAALVGWLASEGPLQRVPAPVRLPEAVCGGRVCAVRADSAGDVLLTGPAIRAVAAGADHLTLLCGPRGRRAAELLPGVDEILEWPAPWLDPTARAVDADEVDAIVKQLQQAELDRSVIFTSFHQSPLPMALLLRLAGVAHISAISEDYPGSLLDVRHLVDDGLPEPERALSLARAAGFELPAGDDGRLRVRGDHPDVTALTGPGAYVVVHPGTSVPARACPPDRCAEYVRALRDAGYRVLVTGGPTERALTAFVAGTDGIDLGGQTDLRQLAAVLAGARCLVVANTGPAHLAAAVGLPVVSLYAPTVPYERWGPYGVPTVRLGWADAPCRDSRATLCPVPSHPCLSGLAAGEVVAAVRELTCAS
jgi:ADP-heptose:LPS heptosyltransferase